MLDKSLTREQAAAAAGEPVARINSWIKEGKLHYYTIDNHIFIYESELNKTVNQDRRESMQRMFNEWIKAGQAN